MLDKSNRGLKSPLFRKRGNIVAYKTLFSPLKIRGLELKNRVIMPGMNTKMVTKVVSEQIIAYHVARAKGGCALNLFEATAVHPRAQANLYMGLYTTQQRDELKKLTSAVHEAGGMIGIQLFHSGFVCEPFLPEGTVAMSTKNMTEAEITEVMEAFGYSARLAVEAGFDTVEFHCAHSYLPHEFLSAGMNKRTDRFGGSLESRASFALGCIREIRKNIPETMPLFMRVGAQDDFLEDGLTADDVIQFINWAAVAGVDVVDVSRGNVLTLAATYEVPPINFERGWNLELTAKIKAGVSIPVMAVGRIVEPEMAEEVLARGKADLVGIGRGQIADPEWCAKSERGEAENIVRCIGCLQGCYDAVIDPRRSCISCLQNPMVSHEHETISAAKAPKRVMVIGGGMAGMESAKLLKKLGHIPTLFEASDSLGGQFVLAGKSPGKQEIEQAVHRHADEAARLGVELRCGAAVTPELIEKERPDAVIIAVGSEPITPDIPGIDQPHVFSSHELLSGRCPAPQGRVLVIGGGAVGVEVAEFLAARGADCTLMEQRKRIGGDMGYLRRMCVKPDFEKYGIQQLTMASCEEIGSDWVSYTQNGQKKRLSCDAVVIAVGAASRDSSGLQKSCAELEIPFYIIGDAKQARNALCATSEALEAVRSI